MSTTTVLRTIMASPHHQLCAVCWLSRCSMILINEIKLPVQISQGSTLIATWSPKPRHLLSGTARSESMLQLLTQSASKNEWRAGTSPQYLLFLSTAHFQWWSSPQAIPPVPWAEWSSPSRALQVRCADLLWCLLRYPLHRRLFLVEIDTSRQAERFSSGHFHRYNGSLLCDNNVPCLPGRKHWPCKLQQQAILLRRATCCLVTTRCVFRNQKRHTKLLGFIKSTPPDFENNGTHRALHRRPRGRARRTKSTVCKPDMKAQTRQIAESEYVHVFQTHFLGLLDNGVSLYLSMAIHN